jgi:ATP-dependent DNA ligase
VVEVKFDYLQGGRFRHGATFLRWRADKPAKDCGYDQLAPPNAFSPEQGVALVKQA